MSSFTKYFDKNGKKIFVGDTVKYQGEELTVYLNEHFRTPVPILDDEEGKGQILLSYVAGECEVVEEPVEVTCMWNPKDTFKICKTTEDGFALYAERNGGMEVSVHMTKETLQDLAERILKMLEGFE